MDHGEGEAAFIEFLLSSSVTLEVLYRWAVTGGCNLLICLPDVLDV